MLNLSAWEFDQGPQGWHEQADTGDLKGAAEAIRLYLVLWSNGPTWHRDIPRDRSGQVVEPYILYWHRAEILALYGDIQEAIRCLEDSIVLSHSDLFVSRRRAEIARLQSRGSTRPAVVAAESAA